MNGCMLIRSICYCYAFPGFILFSKLYLLLRLTIWLMNSIKQLIFLFNVLCCLIGCMMSQHKVLIGRLVSRF